MKKILFCFLFANTFLFSNNQKDFLNKDPIKIYHKNEIQNSFEETLICYKNVRNAKDTMLIDKVIPIYKYDYNSFLTNLNDWDKIDYLEKNNLNSIPLPKKDFISSSFYSSLRRSKFRIKKNRKEYVDILFYFIGKKDKIIGYGNPSEFYILNQYNKTLRDVMLNLISEAVKLKICSFFIINDVDPFTVFGRNVDNDIFIYDSDKKKFIDLNGYIEEHTDIFK